jgi:hypothetical protein
MEAVKLGENAVGDSGKILERIPLFISILCDVGGRRCV